MIICKPWLNVDRFLHLNWFLLLKWYLALLNCCLLSTDFIIPPLSIITLVQVIDTLKVYNLLIYYQNIPTPFFYSQTLRISISESLYSDPLNNYLSKLYYQMNRWLIYFTRFQIPSSASNNYLSMETSFNVWKYKFQCLELSYKSIKRISCLKITVAR